MTPINSFLVSNDIRISENPCISPDFCLDWESLKKNICLNIFTAFPKSVFKIKGASVMLITDKFGDHAWFVDGKAACGDSFLEGGLTLNDGRRAYPATFGNLLKIKNLAQEFDPESTIFPSATGTLVRTSIGVGARFTTLHWSGVEWAMSHLGLSLTANQNSIPRELVYDVDEMLAGKLDTVPFPFIGANVPEGHQGQSVQGMSHGAILSKLKTGFHQRRIAWGFNADHQPIGGKFDSREDRLVEGCALASYITFDLSPELAQTQTPQGMEELRAYVKREIPADMISFVSGKLHEIGLSLDEEKLGVLFAYVWPAMKKMKVRDEKYRAIRERLFSTPVGKAYFRELSIDELPGLTPPETTAVMLLVCQFMDMPVQYIAPAFGFQKNFPYPDNDKLREMISATWNVCQKLGVSIGFHSGSGKSAENYRVMGEVTGGCLEVKTSGRYTYEMGVALSQSKNGEDKKLWVDWYSFTREMAISGAFSSDETERKMARQFIEETLRYEKQESDVFASPEICRKTLGMLTPSTEHMHWFEYNFLYVLAAGGKAKKEALGDHSPAGYAQRKRFYKISDEAKLNYAKRVADYLLFLAESAALVKEDVIRKARKKLDGYTSISAFEADI